MVARESTSNDLTKSGGVIRVAPSAKVGGSPRSHPEQRSEAVQLSVSQKVICLSEILFFLRKGEMPQKRKF
jgi:hypothetical protein